MTSTANACKGRNRRGEPCAAPAQEGSDWCYFHDPAKADERRAARLKGAHARHGRKVGAASAPGEVTLRTIDDCLTLLEQEATELLALERSVSRSRALVSLVSAAGKLIVEHELEQRLAALERRLDEHAAA